MQGFHKDVLKLYSHGNANKSMTNESFHKKQINDEMMATNLPRKIKLFVKREAQFTANKNTQPPTLRPLLTL